MGWGGRLSGVVGLELLQTQYMYISKCNGCQLAEYGGK